jgi:leucyl aminopeptidase
VKALSGQTVEILNTDAEGRLVLADCITYAIRQFKPREIIDFATLTGAVIIALGEHKAGLFSNSDKLAGGIFKAGEASGEEVWRLPLGEKYRKQIESKVADMANIDRPDRQAGAIVGAEFLLNFAGDTDWAHIDIAGVNQTTNGTDTSPAGSTGFGVALVAEFVKDRYG